MIANLLLSISLALPLVGEPVPVATQPAMLAGTAGVWVFYSDLSASFRAPDGTELASVSSSDRQELTTRWTNARGVEHEVSTPVSGRSDGARRASVQRHTALVALMQRAFPPAPRQGR